MKISDIQKAIADVLCNNSSLLTTSEIAKQEAVNGFYIGNIIKYVVRYRGKAGLADLLKARDYLDKLIEATA